MANDLERRIPQFIILTTNAEIAARNLPFNKEDIVHNTDTGETRVGGGLWADMKSYKGQEDVNATVRVATTANIADLATGLATGATVDGTVLAAGDLVLVKDQSATKDNGIYVAGAVPARHASYNTMAEMAGALVKVSAGTSANKLFRCTSAAGGTMGTDPVNFFNVVQGTLRFAALGQLATLPAKTAYTATDLVVLEQADGTLVKMALSDFKTNMA